MAPQVTQKKTLKLKRPGADEGGDAPGSGVPASLRTPPSLTVEAKPASYTLAAILALVAVLLFGALLLLQFTELSYYKSAFPTGLPTAPSL